MHIESWLLFVSTCLVASMTPGPGIISVISHSIQYGLKKSLPLMLGILTGLLILAIAAISGLGVLLESSETLFTWLQYAGAAYLFYIGAMTFFSKSSLNLEKQEKTAAPQKLKLYLQGVGLSLINPKALGFFSVLFLPFIDKNENIITQSSILVLTLLGCSTFALIFYSFFAQIASPTLKNSKDILNKVTGGTFMLMSTVLIYPSRT